MKALGKIATLLVAMACALPAIAQSDETAKRFHVFPQLADGGGWQSFLLVTNAAQSSSFCTFELHGLSLDRFPEVSGITTSGSTATFEIPGPSGYRVWRTKNESALATGYATLDCTAPTVAQVLYASRDGSGTTTGMATVFSSQAGGVFQFPVLTPEASLGIAIANDTITDASCRFVLESPDRQNLGQATLPVPSKSNVAKFLHEVIQIPDGFTEGSATVSCDQQVSLIGLQFAGVIFTTLPPAVLSTTPVSLTTPAGLAPADQAAFDTLVVGKQIVQDANNRLIFIAAGRIREIEDGTPSTGNYRYTRTEPNTGMLTYTYDETGNAPNVERSDVLFTFTSATAGTFVYTYIEGGVTQLTLRGSFELVDADPPPPPMSSTCAAGLVIQPGGSCDVVVGGSTVGTFSVSSTSGCLRIGGGFIFCSGRSHNFQGSRFNQYLVTFVANRRPDGSWEITRYSIST